MRLYSKLLFIVLILSLLGFIPLSSCKEPDDCGDLSQTYFSIQAMSVKTVDIFYKQTLDTSSHCRYDNVEIQLGVKDWKIAENQQKPSQSFGLISSAYACSPAPARSTQHIKSLAFIASAETVWKGDTIHVNDTLTDYFFVYHRFWDSAISIDSFLTLKHTFTMDEPVGFRIIKSPENSTKLMFDIYVKLSDDKIHAFKNTGLTFY